VTVVLPLGDPLDVAWLDERGSRRRAWSVVAGLHVRPAVLRHDGRMRGLQVSLTPWGARMLLGVPAGEMSGLLLGLDDLAPSLRTLPERVADAAATGLPGAGRTAATSVVHQVLLDAIVRGGAPPVQPAARRALALLASGVPAAAAARELGCSRRRLHGLVRAETGLSPTQYRRVARFQRARALLVAQRGGGSRPSGLADVAVRSGFADQAHLTREFVALAGCPPSVWLREEFPFLQDPASRAEEAETDPARPGPAPRGPSDRGGRDGRRTVVEPDVP